MTTPATSANTRARVHEPATSRGRGHAPSRRTGTPAAPKGRRSPRRRDAGAGSVGIRGAAGRQGIAGFLFTAPAVILIIVFVAIPIVMAVWVSLLHWNGSANPFSGGAQFVGLDNYRRLLTTPGLLQQNFAYGLRNNLYYVILVVPGTIVASFGLALLVNQQRLRGRGFFRTLFYFPSITSAVAITVTFLFLFQNSGVVNQVLSWFGIKGPEWFVDPRGAIQALGQNLGFWPTQGDPTWGSAQILGMPIWQWLVGPTAALVALAIMTIWASSGTFMLFFLAGLQNIGTDVEEAAYVDGASTFQRFKFITVPLMHKSLALVTMLVLIGSWQVFDSVYLATQGGPQNSTLTPAYLSYQTSFGDGDFGGGAAISVVLFAIIMVFTIVQHVMSREKD